MPTLPRGIRAVTWKNKDKKTQTRYRVRVNTKEFKADKLFDDLQEAIEFLNLSKSKRGKEVIFNITEKEIEERNQMMELLSSPPLFFYIEKYIDKYVKTREQETYLQKRNVQNILSFYKTIQSTKIEYRHSIKVKGGSVLSSMTYPMKPFGQFKVSEVSAFEINAYIQARLAQGKKKISVSREITFISRLFEKLKYIDPHFRDLQNPTRDFDRDLLKDRIVKRVFRLDEKVEEKLFAELKNYRNPELHQIVALSLLTSCRRSEIVTLTWEQIHPTYIQLWHTKSGKPRKVYLTKEAADFIKTIPKRQDDPRLFTYTLAGFEGSFDKFKERLGLKGKLRFHDFRRESIARFVEKAGNNSLILSEILGYESIRKLEQLHVQPQQLPSIDTQKDLEKHFGHSTPAYTKVYYNLNIKK